jgi:hypothetical protein
MPAALPGRIQAGMRLVNHLKEEMLDYVAAQEAANHGADKRHKTRGAAK